MRWKWWVCNSILQKEQLLIPEHAINHSSHLFHKNALPFFAVVPAVGFRGKKISLLDPFLPKTGQN